MLRCLINPMNATIFPRRKLMENTPYLYDTADSSAEPTCQLARLSPSQNPGLDAGGPDQLPLDQPGRLEPVCGQSRSVESKHGTPLSTLARQRQDRRAHTLGSAHAAGHGGLVWQAALCGPGYLDVVGYLLHRALVGDLPGASRPPDVVGAGAWQCRGGL